MTTAGKKIVDGLRDALAYAKIDALLRRTKRKRSEEVSQYDWGYRDGVMAARALFGKESVTAPSRKRTIKAKTKPRKFRSLAKNPIAGTWTKRNEKSGKFMDVKADAKPFKGVRRK